MAGSGTAPRRRGGLRPHNWSVLLRLVILILLPTVAAVALGGLRVGSSAESVRVYGRVERLAELGNAISRLTHEYGEERDLAVGFIATGRRNTGRDTLASQFAEVDAAATEVRGALSSIDTSFSAEARNGVRAVGSRLDAINTLRSIAIDSQVPATVVLEKYSESIADLIAFTDHISEGVADQVLSNGTRALAAISRAKEQASRQRGLLYLALNNGAFAPTELSTLLDARSREEGEIVAFRQAATLSQRQFFDDTIVGPEADQAHEYRQRVISQATVAKGRLDIVPGRRDADVWRKASTGLIDQMRVAEQRLENDVLARSRENKSAAQVRAGIDGTLIAAVLLLVLVTTLLMARSLVKPLRKLRADALDIAGDRLPALVGRLRDPDTVASEIKVDPIGIDSTNEIGEVARAFDEVHREAVRLASNEAMLRGNISAMFVNLSRRSQSLIERQLRIIDELEQGEQDEAQLAKLFDLDHLATRMRRNNDNLLVLGGHEQVRRWNQPVLLMDIVRASLSEVEKYNRVGVNIQGELSVVGPVVNDLVHLVAELVENATVFSADHTKVTVSGDVLSGGGAMLQITDNGVGMTRQELDEANWRLANPPVVDISVARRMGLFVVGRLARRHGIRVELRAALSGGITAFVLLPAQAVVQNMSQTVQPRRLDELAVPDSPAALSARPSVTSMFDEGLEPGSVMRGSWDEQFTGYDADRRSDRPPDRRSPQAPQPTQPPQRAEPDPPRTGPQPIVGRHTGSQPVVGRETGSQPVVGRETSAPLAGRDTGSQPAVGRHTAPQPIVPSHPGTRRPGDDMMYAAPPPEAPKSGFSWDDAGTTGTPPKAQERSPIFEAMESEWFQRRTPSSPPSSSSSSPGGSSGRQVPPPTWTSRADEAWQAAEVVRRPAAGGKTAAGLPKRVPGRNRVPGAVPYPTQAATPAPQAPPQSADTIRNRFSSFQQGVHRGRAKARSDDSSRTGETP